MQNAMAFWSAMWPIKFSDSTIVSESSDQGTRSGWICKVSLRSLPDFHPASRLQAAHRSCSALANASISSFVGSLGHFGRGEQHEGGEQFQGLVNHGIVHSLGSLPRWGALVLGRCFFSRAMTLACEGVGDSAARLFHSFGSVWWS